MKDVEQRARTIRLLILDVDGVLTDGRLYFDSQGEQLKCFHVRDGHGLVALRHAGLDVAVISGRRSQAVERRMSELGVTLVQQGVQNKLTAFDELLGRLRIGADAVACVGDDAPDVPMLERAGLAIAVADAHEDARAVAHYVTRYAGGCGAVREVCDLLLASRGTRR